ncbi:phosphoglycerate kinase [Rubellimicrobium sp. CFH 75288]|uniref:phosphoglycerate kinase n=1 Tax=Rubellimicrobium sp. CFH 75288 TaxID=2697034 RepID=UPI0014135F68|nr:phosphoglycerate kinase [Rubellimicrobium sp. CFH 75288]NAZ35506.1 phosphoglycerate kinase [Rubellimicrobium sp. CFH 75288]
MAPRTLSDMDLDGRRVLTRVDLNVPVEGGRVTDTTRIERVVPTIRAILEAGGKPVLLAHFGRPKGRRDEAQSLRQVVPALEEALGRPVAFAPDCVGPEAEAAVAAMQPGDVLLLENTRFHAGEEANDPAFADALARLGDVYCNDAFSAAHRAHASTEGLAHRLPACAGLLMAEELSALDRALGNPERPVVAIVGGSKVSTKIDLLMNLVGRVQHLVIGGGMANTFLHAQGAQVGRSLHEPDLADTARAILRRAEEAGCEIVLPRDVVTARALRPGEPEQIHAAHDCPPDQMILDIGPQTVSTIDTVLHRCRTLIWNGPVGAFETKPFDAGTHALALKAAELTRKGALVSVAGGGDTVAALNEVGVAGDFTYVSTAGGAFLEWMEGKVLPGVAALG